MNYREPDTFIDASRNSGANTITVWADSVSFWWRQVRFALTHESVYNPHVLTLCRDYNHALHELRSAHNDTL